MTERHFEGVAVGMGEEEASCLVETLLVCTRDVTAARERVSLRPLGVSSAGFAVLSLLNDATLEIRQLAAALQVTRPAIVSVVHTLERRGLVVRERSYRDRRLVGVSITASGLDTVARVRLAHAAFARDLVDGLKPHESQVLSHLLERLARSARGLVASACTAANERPITNGY